MRYAIMRLCHDKLSRLSEKLGNLCAPPSDGRRRRPRSNVPLLHRPIQPRNEAPIPPLHAPAVPAYWPIRYESIDHRTIRIITEMHPLTVGNGITFNTNNAMTPKELYEWAKRRKIEDVQIRLCDGMAITMYRKWNASPPAGTKLSSTFPRLKQSNTTTPNPGAKSLTRTTNEKPACVVPTRPGLAVICGLTPLRARLARHSPVCGAEPAVAVSPQA